MRGRPDRPAHVRSGSFIGLSEPGHRGKCNGESCHSASIQRRVILSHVSGTTSARDAEMHARASQIPLLSYTRQS